MGAHVHDTWQEFGPWIGEEPGYSNDQSDNNYNFYFVLQLTVWVFLQLDKFLQTHKHLWNSFDLADQRGNVICVFPSSAGVCARELFEAARCDDQLATETLYRCWGQAANAQWPCGTDWVRSLEKHPGIREQDAWLSCRWFSLGAGEGVHNANKGDVHNANKGEMVAKVLWNMNTYMCSWTT